ncbi:MAG: hypothetical protein JKX75_03325 [Gammaproteobacteria bacterium]|nr:hypothetical protein [Gammaproteobacteria bacterium]
MLCSQRNIKLRQTSYKNALSPRYVLLCEAVIIPVFCTCMISAIGTISGGRHVTTMQFDVDADTEYINVKIATYSQQQINIEEKLFN